MNLTITNIKNFKAAMQVVNKVVEKKNTMPVLSHVQLAQEVDRTFLTATDIETAIRCDVTDLVTVTEPGGTLLPAKKMTDYLKTCKAPTVSLETLNKDWAQLGSMKLATLPTSDFPCWPKSDKPEISGVEPSLYKSIDKVLSSAGESDTRYTLNGLWFDFKNKRVVGTDGHRLSLAAISCNHAEPKIVPRRSCTVLKAIKGDPAITVDEKYVTFDYGKTTLVARAIDGTYPNVDNVLPKSFETIFCVNRELFAETVSRVSLMSKERASAIEMYYIYKGESEQELVISSSSPGSGSMEERIPCVWDGRKEFYFGMNAKYILNALSAMDGEDAVFCLNDQLDPMKLVDPENADSLHILMPMRIDEKQRLSAGPIPNTPTTSRQT